MEFCVQAWGSYLRKVIEFYLVESIQRRAANMIQGLKEKSYYDCLMALNRTTLETRYNRGDLIETFMILKGYERLNKDYFLNGTQQR